MIALLLEAVVHVSSGLDRAGLDFALFLASSNKLTSDLVWPTNKISAHTKSSS